MDRNKRRSMRRRKLKQQREAVAETSPALAAVAKKDEAQTAESTNTKELSEIFASRQRSVDFLTTLYNSLPNPDPILEAKGETIDAYEDLLYDSRVIACTDSRKAVVKSLEWALVSETEDQTAIDFHNEYLKNYKMEDVIDEILDAVSFGYKPLEIMWLPVGGKIIPAEFVGKPSRWFVYDNENQLRMLTETNQIDGEEVPDNKFIVARNKASYDNPYGRSVLAACYWPVLFRRSGFKFLAIFVEKYGMPFLVATAPAGEKTERMEEILDIISDLVQDGVTVVPEDYKLDVLEGKEGKGKSDSLHKVFLDIMNNEIALAILGTNLSSNVEGGSYAAAAAHMEVRDDLVEADTRIVEGAFNELIRLVHRINFGNPDDAPVFKLFAEENIDKNRAERDEILVDKLGVKFTNKYIEEKYNLTPDDYELVAVESVEVQE